MAPGTTISASDVARLYESIGLDRIITLDIHAEQIQGFVSPNLQWDNLQGKVLALAYFRPNGEVKLQKPCIVSPDAGGVKRAKDF